MRIVMLGAPGSGKGTQTKLVEQTFGAIQLSTGDLLRAAVAAGTVVGKQAQAAMDAGELVSDAIVLTLIRDRLTGKDAPSAFVLDGFPRNLSQAEALGKLLAEVGKPLDKVIQIHVPAKALWQRISGRRSCRRCGAVYNVYHGPSKQEGVCDKCGGETYQRDDDNESTVENRLRTYENQTAPLVEYYRGLGLLETVPGEGGVEKIFAGLKRVLQPLAT